MSYFMVRNFDHAGYYETRLVLAALGLTFALWRLFAARDGRYLLMFSCGVLFQAGIELSLSQRGLRGAGYNLSVFGVTLSRNAAILFQGLAEGGILAMMSFWFADLWLSRTAAGWKALYGVMCGLIVALAFLVGWLATGSTITSPRPMFVPRSTMMVDLTIGVSLLLLWFKGRDGYRCLGWYYLGSIVYVVLTFVPLQLMRSRYIGSSPAGEAVPVDEQAAVMAWSLAVEVAGGKIHYFVLPYVTGLLKFGDREVAQDEGSVSRGASVGGEVTAG